MRRLIALCLACFLVAGCQASDLANPPSDLGQFRLGHNVVVAPNLTQGPLSRAATEDEWIAAVSSAVGARLGKTRYQGAGLYHLGISVEGYVLAAPGVPLVLSPKSALILSVTVWDDAARAKLNPEPEQITVLESLSGETLIGSGLTKTREEQIENLSFNAALAIEKWLVRNADWFRD